MAAVITARDRADFDEHKPIALSGDWLREWWSDRAGELETDAWVAVADGKVVGYAHAFREGEVANIVDESCVHPEFRGRGIGSQFVELAESWAREQSLGRLHMHAVNDDFRRLLEQRGFENVRFFWRMELELEGEQPEPQLPPGFAIRAYRPGADDHALHAMHQAAFADHWEFVAQTLESWLRGRTTRGDYDPELWQLAVCGDEIAGAALSFAQEGLGWILDLAVAPARRKLGLGLVLLRAAFSVLEARDVTKVGLEVDAENETGATRLYERAGMRITRRYATFEKRLAQGG